MTYIVNFTNIVAAKQCEIEAKTKLSTDKSNQFDSILSFVERRSYVPFTSCVLEHIITSTKLSNLEKLYYLLADSLALINNRSGKKRQVALSCDQWASKLNCSRSQVFRLQKSLTENGYFWLVKNKNNAKQNNRNIIVPTLPKNIFEELSKSTPNKMGEHLPFDDKVEDRRQYLDRVKLYIKINYHLLQTLILNEHLPFFEKIIWLDFFIKCYITEKSKTDNSNISNFSFVTSYSDLAERYYCNKKYLSKVLKTLQNLNFINAERFLIKRKNNITNNQRQDKSLWKVTLLIPKDFISKEIFNRADMNKTADTIKKEEGTFLDPHVAKFTPLLNRNFKSLNNRSNSCDIFATDLLPTDLLPEESASNSNQDLSNNKADKEESTFTEDLPKADKTADKTTKTFAKALSLKDFYPLNEQDCFKLQNTSHREFNLNAINEILKDISNRLKDRVFHSKKAFMNYMTKVLTSEMRQTQKTNNPNFKITEPKEQKMSKFLTSIENNRDVSTEWRFKRSIIGAFGYNPEKAYNLLSSYVFSRLQNDSFAIVLNKDVELNEQERAIILKQAQIVHEIGYANNDKQGITKLLIETSPWKQKKRNTSSTKYEPKIPTNIWGTIRKELINIFGKETDKYWFNRLEASIDEKAKTITLKAPNSFVYDWITEKYLDSIQYIADIEEVGIDLKENK